MGISRNSLPVIQSGTARLHPKGTSSRFALRAPRRFAPHNDKSGVITVLTGACTSRQRCAGSGMPLPYNSGCGRRNCFKICNCQWRSGSAATDAIGLCVFSVARANCKCLPEIATAPSGPRNDTSGEHGAGNGALHRISRPIAASRTGLAVPDPTVTSLPIQTCKKIGSRLRPRPGSGCLFKKGRKKRESIGKLILQRSAAEAEAPREAVAAALLLLLALILLLALLRIA